MKIETQEQLVNDLRKCVPYASDVMINDVLSVVKQHIGVVAQVCPECGGHTEVELDDGSSIECPECHGIGVVASNNAFGQRGHYL